MLSNRYILFFVLFSSIFSLTSCFFMSSKPITITIKPIGNMLKYDVESFEVKRNQEVTIVLDNVATVDIMKHNIVFLNDRNAVEAVGKASINHPDHIPDHRAIIAATPITDPGKISSVTFNAPEKKGKYIYMCTYPNHYIEMKGEMIVK